MSVEEEKMKKHLPPSAISVLSHEMRTPLNAIIGMAALLEKSDLSSAQLRYLKVLQNASGSLTELLSNFLDLQKIEAGELSFQQLPFYLHDVLDAVIEIMSLRCSERNIELFVHVDNSVPAYLFGDRYRLQQVLLNLVSNACKMTKTGFVKIRVAECVVNESTAEVKNPTLKDLDIGEPGLDFAHVHLDFTVEDTGPGVPKEDIANLFTPFWQRKGEEKKLGTGLGLAISQKLVHGMNGELKYQQRAKGGSLFIFDVYFQVQQIERHITEKPHKMLLQSTIIICHPHQEFRQSLVEMLSPWNLKIRQLSNCQDIDETINEINLAAQNPPEILLLCSKDVHKTEKIHEVQSLCHTLHILYFITADEAYELEKLQNSVKENSLCDPKVVCLALIKPIKRNEFFATINQLYSDPKRRFRNTRNTQKRLLVHQDGFKGKKILVLDDQEEQLLFLSGLLEATGHLIQTTGDADQALGLIQEEDFDLVFTDLEMPNTDGFSFLDKLQTWAKEHQQEHRCPPVIAMSSHLASDMEKQCLDVGFSAYLNKSLGVKSLISLIDKYARKKLKEHDAFTLQPRVVLQKNSQLGTEYELEDEINEARMALLRGDMAALELWLERIKKHTNFPLDLYGDLRESILTKDKKSFKQAINMLEKRLKKDVFKVALNLEKKQEEAQVLTKVLQQLLPKFYKRRRDDLKVLYSACSTKDWRIIQKLGHQMAGTGTTFAFPKITELGQNIEKAAKAKDLNSVKAALIGLEKQISKFPKES